jgi:hypothetical protein
VCGRDGRDREPDRDRERIAPVIVAALGIGNDIMGVIDLTWTITQPMMTRPQCESVTLLLACLEVTLMKLCDPSSST